MGATRKTTKPSPKKVNPKFDLHTDDDGKKHTAARPDEMTPDVLEFIHAIDLYKRVNQRPFPNWSEILEILKSLGYSRAV